MSRSRLRSAVPLASGSSFQQQLRDVNMALEGSNMKSRPWLSLSDKSVLALASRSMFTMSMWPSPVAK